MKLFKETMNIIVTCSDKRVTKCQFGHSELLIPTESATMELYCDISFKTVHHTEVKSVYGLLLLK